MGLLQASAEQMQVLGTVQQGQSVIQLARLCVGPPARHLSSVIECGFCGGRGRVFVPARLKLRLTAQSGGVQHPCSTFRGLSLPALAVLGQDNPAPGTLQDCGLQILTARQEPVACRLLVT